MNRLGKKRGTKKRRNHKLRDHPELIPFEYSQITKYLYIGTNLCCQTHFHSDLIRKGIEADLCLEDKQMDAPFGAKYFLWLPTKDHAAPSPQQVALGVQFIDFCVKNKIKVYVHCERGHTRSPMLVAAYLVSVGMSMNEAIALLRTKRPTTHLTKSQQIALKNFSKTLPGMNRSGKHKK